MLAQVGSTYISCKYDRHDIYDVCVSMFGILQHHVINVKLSYDLTEFICLVRAPYLVSLLLILNSKMTCSLPIVLIVSSIADIRICSSKSLSVLFMKHVIENNPR